MSLKEQIESGKVFTEYGHTAQEDQEYERIIEAQRRKSKQLCFRYNQTDPMDEEGREKLVRELLGGTGKTLWLEAPIHFAYGCHTTVGDQFYSNFNLTVVDDGRVSIGNSVMFGPNVTISTTGHPVHPYYRIAGRALSLPVVIEDGVWIGANVVVMPGVIHRQKQRHRRGERRDARHSGERRRFGTPCRVIRPITDADLETIRPGMTINADGTHKIGRKTRLQIAAQGVS